MFLLVGAGGMLGACARFGLGAIINSRSKAVAPFPAGTFVINILGSFILGILASRYAAGTLDESLWLLFGMGFCGAFTTFSTFGTETMSLIETKHNPLAIIYVIASVIVGFCFAWLGYIL